MIFIYNGNFSSKFLYMFSYATQLKLGSNVVSTALHMEDWIGLDWISFFRY